MSIVNMLSWWQWGLLAAIPPAIVLLYFLKLKRVPLTVPSTYLWRKSIEDLHVNSVWQRLRRNLLLLLQMLVMAAAVAALLRPGWHGSRLTGDRFIFLVDASASMSATDVQPTRLAEAKRRVAELVDQMSAGDVAMIISFSDVARVEQQFTDNRRELAAQLATIAPTNRVTQITEALRAAAGLASPGRSMGADDAQRAEGLPATLYIFSDGKFADVEDFSLANLRPEFWPIGQPRAPNVAITAFSTRGRQDRKEQLQAFGRLENLGPEPVVADVELLRDGALVDANRVTLEPGRSGGVVFDLGDVHSGELQLRTRSGDALSLDDQAFAAIDPPAPGRVLLVTTGDDPLELALKTDSAAELAQVEITRPEGLESHDLREKLTAGYYALVIFDACRPAELPQSNTLFIGRLPPGGAWSAGPGTAAPQIIDVESSHPLMQWMDLNNVKFAECTPLKPPPGDTVLASTDAGPLLAIAPREGFEDAVLGASIISVNEQGDREANTDWPLRLSFPVFFINALSYFGGSNAGAAASVQPGQPIALRGTGSSDAMTVRTPSGKSFGLSRGRGERFRFSATEELGVYHVEQPGEEPRRFVVNLFDRSESDIEPRAAGAIRIGYVEVKGQADWEGARRELWRPLLVLALGVLAVEWYIYNRRVYV